jgi:lipoyl(octanoyl) transferase
VPRPPGDPRSLRADADAPITVVRAGRVPYLTAWAWQRALASQRAAGTIGDVLVLVEHPPVYTLGRRADERHLVFDAAERERRGIGLHRIDRGGDVTYHGPGQLVGYPLLPLAPGGLMPAAGAHNSRLPQADYIGYVRRLEQTPILAAAKFGVAAKQVEGLTGVWLPPAGEASASGDQPAEDLLPRKLAAIGVKVDVKGVSRHGFALNVNPDMTYWQGIIGCGLEGYPSTSLAELLSSPVSMEEVCTAVIEAFGTVFGYEMVEVS